MPRKDARPRTQRDDRIERWYADHHARLRRYCARLLGDDAAADDIAQETLLRAWSNRHLFQPGADIRPWLFRVARNLCTDALRSRSRFADVAPPEQLDLDADPIRPIERAETDALVRRAFDALTPRQREILLLRDVEGVDYPELAARMGVNENTARAVLFRARRGLRKRFLEVARATATLALWPLMKLRRAFSDPHEQLAAAAAKVTVGLAAATAMLVLPGVHRTSPDQPPPPPLPSPSVVHDAGEVRRVPAPAQVLAERTATAPAAETPGRSSVPRTELRVDRNGEVHTRTTARNPATGDDAEVWADVWREAGSRESFVLDHYDDVNQTTCSDARATCDAIDGILSEGP